MQVWLLIGLGGFVGSIARYALSGLVQRRVSLEVATFPVGTLVVNLSGCFLIGLLIAIMQERILLPPELRLALLVGLLGGFTTFSTYGYEMMLMMQSGLWKFALLNFTLSNVLGLFLVWGGYRLGQQF